MVQMLLGCAVWGAVVRVTVRAQFCKIDRVLLGMQLGVLVQMQVLLLGSAGDGAGAHFNQMGGRVQAAGCCLGLQLGAAWGDAFWCFFGAWRCKILVLVFGCG